MNSYAGGALAARENPFATHFQESLSFVFDHGNWGGHLARLQELNWRGAIIGQKGSGKTTLLLELSRQLASRWTPFRDRCGYWMIGRERQEVARQCHEMRAAAGHPVLLLVDGIERLSRRDRHWLVRVPQHVVATAHAPCKLPTWIQCRTDKALMWQLLDQLVPARDCWLDRQADGEFDRCRGNLREVFRRLYDLVGGIDPRTERS